MEEWGENDLIHTSTTHTQTHLEYQTHQLQKYPDLLFTSGKHAN